MGEKGLGCWAGWFFAMGEGWTICLYFVGGVVDVRMFIDGGKRGKVSLLVDLEKWWCGRESW